MERWTQEQTSACLDFLINYNFLWDIGSNEYRNRNIKEKQLSDLTSDLKTSNKDFHPELDEKVVKTKIKAIRDTYKRERQKVVASKHTGMGDEETYVPQLAWYDKADAFLRSSVIVRASLSNIDSASNIIERATNSEEEDDPTSIELPNYIGRGAHKRGSRKKQMTDDESLCLAIFKLEQMSNNKPDEFDHMGRSIAAIFRSLDEDDAWDAQIKVKELLRTYKKRKPTHSAVRNSSSRFCLMSPTHLSDAPNQSAHSRAMPPWNTAEAMNSEWTEDSPFPSPLTPPRNLDENLFLDDDLEDPVIPVTGIQLNSKEVPNHSRVTTSALSVMTPSSTLTTSAPPRITPSTTVITSTPLVTTPLGKSIETPSVKASDSLQKTPLSIINIKKPYKLVVSEKVRKPLSLSQRENVPPKNTSIMVNSVQKINSANDHKSLVLERANKALAQLVVNANAPSYPKVLTKVLSNKRTVMNSSITKLSTVNPAFRSILAQQSAGTMLVPPQGTKYTSFNK